jgi:hypothetical protein
MVLLLFACLFKHTSNYYYYYYYILLLLIVGLYIAVFLFGPSGILHVLMQEGFMP